MVDDGQSDASIALPIALDYLAEAKYDRAAEVLQDMLQANPDDKLPCWYLGLIYLLQGQEPDAQATWMLAMMEGEPEQIDEWTQTLVEILRSQAEHQEQLENLAITWAIRQYVREFCPQDGDNLIHLILLSVKLGQFSAATLNELGIVPFLTSEAGKTIGEPRRLQLLKELFVADPLEPALVDLATACFAGIEQPIALIQLLMEQAIEIAHALYKPKLAILYAELCQRVYPNGETLSHLMTFYQGTGEHERAIEVAKQFCLAAQSLPDQVTGAFLLLSAYIRAGNYWNEIFELFELQDSLLWQLTETQRSPLDQPTTLRLMTSSFFLPYLRDSLTRNRLIQNRLFWLCQESVRSYAAAPAQRYAEGLALRRNHDVVHPDSRPLKIGYLSHCLRRNSVGWLARWLIQHQDRQRFQLHGYFWNYQARVRDPLQAWYMEQMDVVRTSDRDALTIAEQIYQDDIDILLDLDSMTADISCEVMALKPAPVQVTWLGWDATGLPAIDYFVVDPYVVPETADMHYSEKLWRLPHTYIAVDGFEVGVPTLRRDELGIPDDAVIYLSAQSSFKRHPETVRLQMQIVKAVPNSYFLVKGIADENLIQDYFSEMAAAEGVSRDRLRFLPMVGMEEVHRANLGIADVVLDTYPYNGATTTLETLWMGIPLVTQVGEHFSSRNSYTMLMNVGVTEGIAWTAAEYVEWGIRFGQDAELRQQVAWKLRQSRQSAPLWNARQFTRDMEVAYQQMWASYVGLMDQKGI
jgi:predicted O-linked N-acetylglucosamine transferase (SPINDLY family)